MARRMRHTMCRCCAMHTLRISTGSTSAGQGGRGGSSQGGTSNQMATSKLIRQAAMQGQRVLMHCTIVQQAAGAATTSKAVQSGVRWAADLPASSRAMWRCIVLARLSATSDSWQTKAATSLAPRLHMGADSEAWIWAHSRGREATAEGWGHAS